jgi:hypothetical protein
VEELVAAALLKMRAVVDRDRMVRDGYVVAVFEGEGGQGGPPLESEGCDLPGACHVGLRGR